MPAKTRQTGPDVVPAADLGKLRQARPRELLWRFLLGAAVSVVAAIIAKSIGARLGGVFLAFPAILPASLTLIQKEENTRDADRNAIGAVLGGLGLVFFAVTAEAGFKYINPYLTVFLALAAWIVVSLLLYWVLAVLRPEDCDRRQD